MRCRPLLVLFCLALASCSVRTSGLSAGSNADAGPRDGGGSGDARPGRDATDALDAGTSDASLPPPPPPFDSGTPPPADSGGPDAGPPPPRDAGPPGGPVGAPCNASTECAAGLFCYMSEYVPGGYCTRECTSDGECGASGGCANFVVAYYCARRCGTSTECRPGYNCSYGYCLPF